MKRFVPLLCLVAMAPVWGDVIHLRHGRSLRGQIVRETEDAIVLRTPQGEIRVQRSSIERVEEESQATLYLGQARDAVRDQDYGVALERFKLALAELNATDPRRKAIAKEVAAVKRRSDPYVRSNSRRGWSSSGPDPFSREEPEARVRELMAGAEVRADLRARLVAVLYGRGRGAYENRDYLGAAIDFKQAADFASGNDEQTLRGYEYDSRLKVAAGAVRAGNAGLAARAALPVVDAGRTDGSALRGAYLLGRAEELRQNLGAARKAYQEALTGLEVEHVELPVLRELARLRSAGSAVNAESAGVGKQWEWVKTSHFGLVHELDRSDGELSRIVEDAFRDVVKRLRLPSTSGERIAVFLFKDREGYQRSSGARGWSRAHASRLQGQDELVLSIYAYLGEGFEGTLRHEIAHILIWRQLGDAVFPVWAGEGIAQFTEGEAELANNRQLVQSLAASNQLPPWEGALRQMLYPIQETQVALTAFYAQGGVMFEVMANRVGPQKAIKALTRFNKEDPLTVLRAVGIDPAGFFAELEKIARPR